jgi:hypothetical protein
MDFNRYKLLIIPERIKIDESMDKKLCEYLKNNGKIISVFDSIFSKSAVKVIKRQLMTIMNLLKEDSFQKMDMLIMLFPLM